MRYFFLFLLGLIGFAGAAAADVVADYRQIDDGSTIKVQAADNGDARLQYSNQAFYLIIRGGEAYVIYSFPTGPRVVRVSDLQKVYEQTPPKIALDTKVVNQAAWVPNGTASYAGYSGKAYFLRFPSGMSSRPALVVSQDPKLRRLGVPIGRQMDFSIATMKLAGQAIPPNFLKLREYIGTGTPLLFAGYKLEKVAMTPVDPKQFELPAAPLPIEELRANAAAARQNQ